MQRFAPIWISMVGVSFRQFIAMNFSHTVGLSQGYEHQEIELIGLNQKIAAMLLNELADESSMVKNYMPTAILKILDELI